MLPFKQFNGDLASDLDRLGLSASSTNQLAENRISENSYAPISESVDHNVEEDFGYTTDSDSLYVSESTLDRIEALIDTKAISPDEADKLLDGLAEHAPEGAIERYESVVTSLSALADGDVEATNSVEEALLSISEAIDNGTIDPMEALRALIALSDAPVEEGMEALRDEVIENLAMNEGLRTMLKKVKGVFKKVRVKKMTSAERSKSRSQYRKTRATRKAARKKRAKSSVFKKSQKLLKSAQKRFKMESTDELAGRLRGRLAESNVSDEFGMIDRIGRIFELLSERVSDEAVEVMAEQYDILKNGLFEGSADLEAACRPCVAIIAECLKDIEQGNC